MASVMPQWLLAASVSSAMGLLNRFAVCKIRMPFSYATEIFTQTSLCIFSISLFKSPCVGNIFPFC